MATPLSACRTYDLEVVDLHGLVGAAARAEALHVVSRVDLHRSLLHLPIDAHAVVDIVDLCAQTHTKQAHTL